MHVRIGARPSHVSRAFSIVHTVHAFFDPAAMPPTMRIPTVEFRSLLLPPVKIPIRALRTLYRPQCASHVPRPACPIQRLEQRRALNLYKTAKAKTVLGQHKVLNFSPYTCPPLDTLQHKVKLWASTTKHGAEGVAMTTKGDLIADNLSLQDLYDHHVKDGQMLFCMEALKKGMAQAYLDTGGKGKEDREIPEELRNFSTTKPGRFGVPAPKKGKKSKELAGLKTIVMNESSPPAYYSLSLNRAYQFIDVGCVVEFRLRLQGKTLSKEDRIKPADHCRWQWMHSYFPHLRPDFIMKGMPEDTVYVIQPVSDGRVVQWVASKPGRVQPPMDLTKRVFNIKTSVGRSIDQGKQAMLPKKMREQLRDSGVADYSPNTAMPKNLARAKFGRGGNVKYNSEEKKYLKKDAETDGFMTPDENLVKQGPRIKMVDDAFDREMRGGKHRWQGRGHT